MKLGVCAVTDARDKIIRKRRFIVAASVFVAGMLVVTASVLVYRVARGSEPRVVPPSATYEVDPEGIPIFDTQPATAQITADSPGSIEGTIDGQRFRIEYDPDVNPIGVAVWFHGQNGDIDSRLDDPMLRNLVNDGWVVAASEMRGNNWGNHESVEDVTRLVEFAQEKTDARTVLFAAASMGGVASLNSIRFGQVEATCWWGTMPVVDLDAAAESVPNAREEMSAAFGETAIEPYNPSSGDLPAARYRILWSPDDITVVASENAALLEGMVSSELTFKEVTGPHNSPAHFDADDLREFAASCA